MSNNTLKIRIQIQQQPPQAIEEIYPEPEIVYEQVLDWKKIAAAAISLVVILSLLGYLIFGNIAGKSSQSDPVNAETDTISSENISLELNAQAEAPVTESDESNTEQTIISIPIDSEIPNIEDRTVIIPRKKPENNVTASLPVAVNAVPKTAIQPKPHQSSDHPIVLRAQLSSAIISREPVDSIDTVHLKPDETKPIHFYVHLQNQQKRNIRIDWYYNNKLDSQLRLHVLNNNWRTHASKQLDHRRLGSWRVELIDERENQLAVQEFSVISH
ncbi:MAG: hypothetical protein A4S08_05940 [Proteobacteria bacterium SG_bin4]|nr:MAG: hypothetical protein A4S08_05940 [Proteobacteria bacterium SG_bin4]